MRPPGADAGFEALCHDCSACHSVCAESIITIDAKGRPVIDLNRGACTFCGACVDACPTGALSSERVKDWPWTADISAACVSMNGISCRSCQDTCPEQAIRFQLQVGSRAQPILDATACTGCGACGVVCPAQAVSFVQATPAHPEAVQ